MIVAAARASAILHNVLRVRRDPRPILLPANICVDVPLTLLHAGSTLELVDIEEPALTLDRAECLRRVGASPERYGGLVFVHPYGAEVDPEPFFRQLRELSSDLLLVDDRCLCAPDPEARRAAASADLTLWSTGPRKFVDLGCGGFARLAESCRYAESHGTYDPRAREQLEEAVRSAVADRRPFATPVEHWLDLGPPPWPWQEYRARVLQVLPRVSEQRQRLNAIYFERIAAAVQLPAAFQLWRFNISVPAPDRLLRSFLSAGLFAGRHYASLGGGVRPGPLPARRGSSRLDRESVQ